MKLSSVRTGAAVIPLTPLVDVMLILLVFFMVTSTYLDLDMIPVGPEAAEAPAAPQAGGAGGDRGATLLLRISADGRAVLRGRPLDGAALEAALTAEAGRPLLVLPSAAATAQDLVTVMEAAARAGVTDAQIVRVEGEGP